MKKLIASLMTVLFLGSTTGLVLAQTPTTASVTPVAKVVKKHKSHKKVKPTVAPAASTTPASK
jgi:hypothetical protein